MDLVNQSFNFFDWPDFSGSNVIQCPDNTFHTRHLPDIFQWDFVFLWPKPAHCHLHFLSALIVAAMHFTRCTILVLDSICSNYRLINYLVKKE